MLHWYLYPLKCGGERRRTKWKNDFFSYSKHAEKRNNLFNPKESEKHVFWLTNKLFYIHSQLLDYFKRSLFKQHFVPLCICCTLESLGVVVKQCVHHSVCKGAVKKRPPPNSTLPDHYNRRLSLYFFFFPSYSVLGAFLKIPLFYFTRTKVPKLNDSSTWEVSELREQQAECWFENTCWFSLEKQGGREHRKTKFPPSSMCPKHLAGVFCLHTAPSMR